MSGEGLSLEPARSRRRRIPGSRLSALRDGGRRLLVAAAFWTAVLLPGLYVPLLAVAGVDATVALLAVHALALVVGHDYRQR